MSPNLLRRLSDFKRSMATVEYNETEDGRSVISLVYWTFSPPEGFLGMMLALARFEREECEFITNQS